ERLGAVAADDGNFVVAEVYHIPVLIRLIGIAPLLDVGSILHALFGHVQGFITMPVHDRAGITHAPVGPVATTIFTGIGSAVAVVATTVIAIASTAADFEISAAAAIY